MKQNITQKQWEELNIKQQELVYEWLHKSGYQMTGVGECIGNSQVILKEVYFPMSIGEMIEFLDSEFESIKIIRYGDTWVLGEPCCDEDWIDRFEEKELCDALWIACKEKLKSNEK